MFPFKKKKVEEEEKVSEDLPVKKTRKRKKKEEPPKPWGKVERAIVLIILIGSLASSLFFAFKSHNLKITSSKYDTDILKQSLTTELQDKEETYGIWIQAIDNSYKLGINENEEFDSNSFEKIQLFIDYKNEVAKGNIDPNTMYTIKHIDGDLGEPGTKISYDDIANDLEKNLDNQAFSVLLNVMPVGTESKMTTKTTPMGYGTLLYKNSINLTPDPYILIILSKGENTDEANLEIPKIKNIVADWVGK